MATLKEILLWIPAGLIPLFNGAVRILTYQKMVGEEAAVIFSSASDLILIFAYACMVQRWRPSEKQTQAIGRGLLWFGLSTSLHFALGLLVFGTSLYEVVNKYNIVAGETWGLISIFILFAPLLAKRLLHHELPGRH